MVGLTVLAERAVAKLPVAPVDESVFIEALQAHPALQGTESQVQERLIALGQYQAPELSSAEALKRGTQQVLMSVLSALMPEAQALTDANTKKQTVWTTMVERLKAAQASYSEPFSLPSVLPESDPNPVLHGSYRVGRTIERARDGVVNTVIHPIDTAEALSLLVWDIAGLASQTTLGISTQGSQHRNQARWETLKAFKQADLAIQLEAVNEILTSAVLLSPIAVGGVGRVESAGRALKGVDKPLTFGYRSSPKPRLTSSNQYAHSPTDFLSSTYLKGVRGEQAALKALEKLGFEFKPSKLPGNRGFDHIAVRYGASGEVNDILIIESKFSSTGRVSLSQTAGKGKQMGPRWIDTTLEDMMKRGGEVRKTAEILEENSSKVKLRGNVLDPSGINRWKPLTEQISKLHPK